MDKPTIYLAGPLFSMAELNFNRLLGDSLIKKLPEAIFIFPQDYAKKIADQDDFFEKMFSYCVNSIDRSDVLLGLLDGPDVDSGTAVEMGYAYARGKPIIGLRTDIRNSEEKGVNLMISRVCTEMLWFKSGNFQLDEVVSKIAGILKRLKVGRWESAG